MRPASCTWRNITSRSSPCSARQARMRRSRVRRTPAVEFGVAPSQLVEYRHRPDARSGLEQRNDLGVEDIGQGIGPATRARRLLLRWQPRVMPEAVGRGDADSSLRRRRRQRLGEPELHEQPHLMIVDVSAGQLSLPSLHGRAVHTRFTATTERHPGGRADSSARRCGSGSGLRPPPLPQRQYSHPD